MAGNTLWINRAERYCGTLMLMVKLNLVKLSMQEKQRK